jgi:hypothetical protein
MARRPRSFYADLSFRPPESVAAAARRALERRARARQLLHRQELSPQMIDRMVSYFARHDVDKQGSSWKSYGKGRQAWDGWGGDPGRRWATADTRTDQPPNCPEPGKHRRPNDQHLKRGENNTKN